MVTKDLRRRIKVKGNRQNKHKTQPMGPDVACLVTQCKCALDALQLCLCEAVAPQDIRVDPPRERQLLICNKSALPRSLDCALDAFRKLVLSVDDTVRTCMCLGLKVAE